MKTVAKCTVVKSNKHHNNSQPFFLITMANFSETFTFKLTFTAVVNNYERMAKYCFDLHIVFFYLT